MADIGQRLKSIRVASLKPGANCNELMPTSADTVEPLSYMSWVPVEIEKNGAA